MCTVPPATDPCPRTVNGNPSPSISTPSSRNPLSRGAIGRERACSSPSNVTADEPCADEPNADDPRAASGGTKRSTVPARPQSMRACGPGLSSPLTANSVPSPLMRRPSVLSAPIIRSVSRLRSAPEMRDGPDCTAASAARISARLVIDFDPGTMTVACTGPEAGGAGQWFTALSCPAPDFAGWGIVAVGGLSSHVWAIRGHNRSGAPCAAHRRRR